MSLSEAENRLEKRQYGTFLVRYSSIVGCYTVSKVCRDNNKNRITHQRIIRVSGKGYSINNMCFPSLVELIAQAKNHLDLLYPCPGSRYINTIFKPTSSVYVYVQHNFNDEKNDAKNNTNNNHHDAMYDWSSDMCTSYVLYMSIFKLMFIFLVIKCFRVNFIADNLQLFTNKLKRIYKIHNNTSE